VKSIQDMGALIYFLLSYSPDFASIEETFSKIDDSLDEGVKLFCGSCVMVESDELVSLG